MLECKSSTCEFIIQTGFPFVGIFTAYFIYLSPLKDVIPLYKKMGSRDVCQINPYPIVMIFCNTLCQCFYAYVIHNHWVIWHNLGGTVAGLFFVVILYSSNLKKKDFNLATITLLLLTFANLGCAALAFILFHDDYPKAKNTIGILNIVILFGVYVSPLATMYEVIKTRNSSSINFIMTIAMFINSILWTGYGFIINDFYIWFPNVVGIVSTIIQFVLLIVFPSKKKNADKKIEENINEKVINI
ncbi:hypothetical protein BCR32DRAFT_291099 [Anaeromyces robustus]|uniref:Sugar transporter SWEET1 n=1 Tax=Anaeromyces robustus TaxID=1754192 RepID=A0A1Y1XGJ0_9FUNG|nr:hypothetical protein BCR32DRAFT_291099 [Anaeromyces robustus]|eukprot:ORX84847.1 hypothetical protein BCR32DRAFT_291099 [Anaeromyces robustus]